MVLQVIYWILLILVIIGFFVPEPYIKYMRGVDIVLFVIIGIRLFGMPT